jgi:hypothetical protein
MADEHANTDSQIVEAVPVLKTKIPPAYHAALDSRLEALINDPSTDNDVITTLRQEFDPEEPKEQRQRFGCARLLIHLRTPDQRLLWPIPDDCNDLTCYTSIDLAHNCD